MKLLIIGLDALDPYWLEEFLDELPTFARLRQDCEWRICHCDAEVPNTASGWSTIYTGQLSSEHKLLDWTSLGGYNLEKGLASNLGEKFWEKFNRMGYSVGLLNPPLVWPAWKGNLWCVAGYPDPTFRYGQFRGGVETLEHTQGLYSSPQVMSLAPYRYTVDAQSYAEKALTAEDWRDWYREEQKALARIRLGYAKRLIREHPVDVAFICFTYLDRLGHGSNYIMNGQRYYGVPLTATPQDTKEEMRLGYKLADRVVRELMDVAESDNLVVCSDHGFNFSSVTPTVDGVGNRVVGNPTWLSHTWEAVSFVSPNGYVGQRGDADLTWVYRKIVELVEDR